MRMGANKIGIQQEAASLSAIFPFLKETMRMRNRTYGGVGGR